MNTITLQNTTYQTAAKKNSILFKLKETFHENRATIICGMMMLNGYTNVYPLYQALSK